MASPEEPFTPPDDALLPAYAHHYTIKAVCACGHEREIYARPIQRQLGARVSYWAGTGLPSVSQVSEETAEDHGVTDAEIEGALSLASRGGP
jgi:hypothetical protein